jgi:hypothetical protein
MESGYVKWRREIGTPIYYGAGLYWEKYSKALIPATVKPLFINPSQDDIRSLLKQSGLPLLRYSSHRTETPTPWWCTVCDSYDFANYSRKTRNQVRRGRKNYAVRQVDLTWLASHGYSCYFVASSRYRNYRVPPEEQFRNFLLSMDRGPFDHWGIFRGNELAGFAVLIQEDNDIHLSGLNFDPAHLKEYAAYTFFDSILKYYVANQGLRINNGYRPVSHDTDIHDFLLKFGFVRWYGQLQVAYQPWLGRLMRLGFPFRYFLKMIAPPALRHGLATLFFQEELRRKCHEERI